MAPKGWRPIHEAVIIALLGFLIGIIAAVVEWDSLDDAEAFYHSKAWTDFAPQRDKAQKTIRRYVVEAEK